MLEDVTKNQFVQSPVTLVINIQSQNEYKCTQDVFRVLKMSSAETLLLMQFFGIIIGHRIPEDNEYWHLYFLMREILSIVLSTKVNMGMIEKLDFLIKQHHIHYLKLSSKHLTPKHHFMIHYKNTILKMGPLYYQSAMRFEGKHRFAKIISNINLPYTIAIKNQINFLKISGSNTFFKKHISKGCGKSDLDFEEHICCSNCLKQHGKTFDTFSSFKANGITYKAGSVILISEIKGKYTFGLIQNIILLNEEFHFVCRKLSPIKFNKHLYSFEIFYDSCCCVNFENLNKKKVYVLTKINNRNYINPQSKYI